MAAELSSTVLAFDQVFDLILFNIEKIVDDTSLEKLLEILNFTFGKPEEQDLDAKDIKTTTFKFLSQVHCECCAKTISFALRLTGIISSNCEGLKKLGAVEIGGRNILDYLFHEVLKKHELWSDPVIRDSYFKAAFGILEGNDGFVWILHSDDVIEAAMSCLVDNSIFVADSTRKFIAKYLISLYMSSTNKECAIENVLQDLTRHDCLKTKKDVFSRDAIKCLTCFISHLKYLIEQSPSGLARAMSAQVSVSQLLLSMMEQDPKTAQEIFGPSGIMLSSFQLLHFINKDECGKVIDVIITMLTNTSSWNINWLMLLNLDKKDLFCTLLEFVLLLHKRLFMFHAFQLIQGILYTGHLLQFDESWLCSLLILLLFPVHATLHKFEAKQGTNDWTVKDAAKELMETDCLTSNGWKVVHKLLNEIMGSPTRKTVSQSLAAVVEIIGDIKLCHFLRLAEVIQLWCTQILDFLNVQPDDYFSGNSLIKLFIKAITVSIKHDLLDGSGDTMLNAKRQSYHLLTKLLYVSKDSKVLSDCFEGLISLFTMTAPDIIASYLNENICNQITLKQLLSFHCSNSCWSVRDSTLSFLQYIIMTFDEILFKFFEALQVAIIQLLLDNALLLLLWKLLRDPESFVRASSIRFLAVLSSNDVIWKSFREIISLSEVEILEFIVNAFEQEEAAFPRRTTIDLLIFWLEKEHHILWMHLQPENEESFNSTPVLQVLHKACQDFDWEVKLRVLNFMEALLRCGNKLDERIKKKCLGQISTIILAALKDCDQPVRIKGFALLEQLRIHVAMVGDLQFINDTLHYQGSLDHLEDFILQKMEHKNCSLLQALIATDFSEFQPTFRESNLMVAPLPFIRDILAAASDNQHNLLDCY